MDLKGEYTEYLSSLRYIFGGDDSLFFNWSRSMGGNATGLYAFYSGGIFAFISCLFSVEALPIAIEVITLLMIGLCGLTMALFLEFGVSQTKGRFCVVVFASCYALMSYNMVYANCFMWLNGCIFLPLILLGVEQILKGRRGLLMYIFLSAAMINNYYTAYMICIFSVMYLVFRLFGSYQKNKTTGENNRKALRSACLRFIGMALLSAMTAAPVLITVVRDLFSGKLSYGGGEETYQTFYYPFSEVFKKVLPGQYDSITSEGIHPQLYAGLLALVFAILFFVIKRIKIWEKIAAFLVISLLLFSFWNIGLDKIWHGFQIPHWFPFRYAFVFGFFLVYLGYRAFDIIVQERWFGVLADKLGVKPLLIEGFVSCLLLVFCSYELGTNAANYIHGLGKDFGYMESEEYEDFLNKTKPLVDQVKQSDDSWYRMDKDYEFSKNDSMLLGYKGMTHYSSTYNAAVNNMLPRFGIAQGWYWNSGYGATPLMDAVFGVKYRMATKAMPPVYRAMDEKEDVTLYENMMALPLGFAAGENTAGSALPGKDVFTNQNDLLTMLCGEPSELFRPVEYERVELTDNTDLTFTAPDEKPLYLYMQVSDGWWADIYVNDNFCNNYFSLESTCAVYLGCFKAGEPVTVSIRSDNASFSNAWIESLDTDILADRIGKLKSQSLVLSDFGAGSFEGNITLKNGQIIATSIPYDDGLVVYVDDKQVESEKWLDTFLAIPASEGNHRISVTYVPNGLQTGIVLAIIGLLCAVAWLTVPKWGKRFQNDTQKGKEK